MNPVGIIDCIIDAPEPKLIYFESGDKEECKDININTIRFVMSSLLKRATVELGYTEIFPIYSSYSKHICKNRFEELLLVKFKMFLTEMAKCPRDINYEISLYLSVGMEIMCVNFLFHLGNSIMRHHRFPRKLGNTSYFLRFRKDSFSVLDMFNELIKDKIPFVDNSDVRRVYIERTFTEIVKANNSKLKDEEVVSDVLKFYELISLGNEQLLEEETRRIIACLNT